MHTPHLCEEVVSLGLLLGALSQEVVAECLAVLAEVLDDERLVPLHRQVQVLHLGSKVSEGSKVIIAFAFLVTRDEGGREGGREGGGS